MDEIIGEPLTEPCESDSREDQPRGSEVHRGGETAERRQRRGTIRLLIVVVSVELLWLAGLVYLLYRVL